jgi:predicted N-acetyltransferase YhbS
MKELTMNIIIKPVTDELICDTLTVVKLAFDRDDHQGEEEQELVKKLIQSEGYIPELSLVACVHDQFVGHLLLTKIHIKTDEALHESLALAPIGVLKEYQNQGVGKQLIWTGLEKAKSLGYQSVIVLGHKDYYPKFGFKKAIDFHLSGPFQVKDEYFMALELKEGALTGGKVIYPQAFFEI